MKQLLYLLICLFQISSTVFSQEPGEWEWLYPRPQGMSLYAVQRINPTTWYFAGVNGVFLKTTDKGETWNYNFKAGKQISDSDIPSSVWGMHFIDENTGVTVGTGASIMKTTDAGNTWNPVQGNPLSGNLVLFSVTFIDSQTGFITGGSGTFLKTTDGGDHWVSIDLGTTAASYSSWSPDGNLILVATNNGQVKRSTNGGSSWTTVNISPAINITKIDGTANLIYLTGTMGVVQASTDGGVNWTSLNTGIPSNIGFNDMDVVNGKIYLTGPPTEIYFSSNMGGSWSTISLTTPETEIMLTRLATDASPDGDTLFVTSGLGIILSRQGATAPIKSHTKLLTTATGNAIWVSQNGKNLITANGQNANANLLRSTDYGNSWDKQIVNTGSTESMYTIHMLDSLTGFVGGTNCSLFKTTNGGVTWDSINTSNTNPTAIIRKIAFVSMTTGWFFTYGPSTSTGTIFKTTDGGMSWFRQPLGVPEPEPNVTKAWMVDSLRGWVIGTMGPYKTTDGGNSWSKDSIDGGVLTVLNDIQMVDENNGCIVANGGKAYKTTNGGTLWQLMTLPVSSINLTSVQMISVNDIFIFGNNGAVLRTTDGGVTWLLKNLKAPPVAGSYRTWDSHSNTLSVYTSTQFGFVLKNNFSVVPIELSAFSASVSDRDVVLEWSTVTELNNRGFEIQRKKNGNDWETISFINGKGTTTNVSSYIYTDKNLTEGSYSYRIKQIDFDGTIWYSYSVEVEIGVPLSFDLSQNFPNPFNPSSVIQFSLPVPGMTSLRIFSSTGEEVALLVNEYKSAGTHSAKFDASRLSSGIYFYKLESGQYSSVKKMSLIK